MVIVSESVRGLKGFLQKTGLNEFAMAMLLRMVVAFISHPGRMSCSAAAGSIASEAVHRGQLTRFLARARWQKLIFSTTKPNLKAATPDDVKILMTNASAKRDANGGKLNPCMDCVPPSVKRPPVAN